MNGSIKNTPCKSLLIEIHNDLRTLPGDASDYEKLYSYISNDELIVILSKLHAAYIKCFESLNHRLPAREDSNRHYHADSSRTLIAAIETTRKAQRLFQTLDIPFLIDEDYRKAIDTCEAFLQKSGGSEIPIGMKKITPYYADPIFHVGDYIDIPETNERFAKIISIGEGGYATVHKFKDPLTNITFVIKKAKKNLTEKEIERFKIEYQTLKKLSSPYIVNVYSYNESDNSYLMEKMDSSLAKFLEKNSSTTLKARKSIGLQIIKGFTYMHSKRLLHRDISPNNILIKKYEDGTIIAKIADFGLVKTPQNDLTSCNTTMKGFWYNDPELLKIGFNHYAMKNELYTIVSVLYFLLTGRTTINANQHKESTFYRLSREFMQKGTSPIETERFSSLDEVRSAFLQIFKDTQVSEI